MIAQGAFPDREAPSGVRHGEPRVGDGIFVLDRDSRVQYASPNAVSLMHRLGHGGEIEGAYLAEVVSTLSTELRQVDETPPLVLTGRAPWRTELEVGRTSVSRGRSRSPTTGADRGDRARPRRLGDQAAQARVALPRRDDQGDAPSGEEQPADGLRAPRACRRGASTTLPRRSRCRRRCGGSRSSPSSTMCSVREWNRRSTSTRSSTRAFGSPRS